jgi:AraC family transcriptional regulator
MIYSERIQNAIDKIESLLNEAIDIEKIAGESCMSIATFYRTFFILTGHSIYEYIKKRRLTEAAINLISSQKQVITVAFEYGYESHEAFTRAFKSFFNTTPYQVKKKLVNINYFRRINLMSNKENLLEKVEIIKVPELTIASCHIIGDSPECKSRDLLIDWAKSVGLPYEIGPAKFYGFDNPDLCRPANAGEEHGYENWLTINTDVKGNDKIKIKKFNGGLYAGCETTVRNVGKSWRKLINWVETSRYKIGEHQFLEEPLKWDFQNEENIKLRILVPIKKSN